MEDAIDTLGSLVTAIQLEYAPLPKQIRIRVEKWMRKICEPTRIPCWQANQVAHAKLLLHQIRKRKFSEPFCTLPPHDGPLPRLPEYLKLRKRDCHQNGSTPLPSPTSLTEWSAVYSNLKKCRGRIQGENNRDGKNPHHVNHNYVRDVRKSPYLESRDAHATSYTYIDRSKCSKHPSPSPKKVLRSRTALHHIEQLENDDVPRAISFEEHENTTREMQAQITIWRAKYEEAQVMVRNQQKLIRELENKVECEQALRVSERNRMKLEHKRHVQEITSTLRRKARHKWDNVELDLVSTCKTKIQEAYSDTTTDHDTDSIFTTSVTTGGQHIPINRSSGGEAVQPQPTNENFAKYEGEKEPLNDDDFLEYLDKFTVTTKMICEEIS